VDKQIAKGQTTWVSPELHSLGRDHQFINPRTELDREQVAGLRRGGKKGNGPVAAKGVKNSFDFKCPLMKGGPG